LYDLCFLAIVTTSMFPWDHNRHYKSILTCSRFEDACSMQELAIGETQPRFLLLLLQG